MNPQSKSASPHQREWYVGRFCAHKGPLTRYLALPLVHQTLHVQRPTPGNPVHLLHLSTTERPPLHFPDALLQLPILAIPASL